MTIGAVEAEAWDLRYPDLDAHLALDTCSLTLAPETRNLTVSSALPLSTIYPLQTMDDIQFMLLDFQSDMVKEWKIAFDEHTSESIRSNLTFVHESLQALSPENMTFDCIVSPANSYGRLDGRCVSKLIALASTCLTPIYSFDHYLACALSGTDHRGDDYWKPTKIAQAVLYEKWRGYAPPGTCTMIPLKGTDCEANAHSCGFIALCPTMRTPEGITWHKDIVYNVIWSLLNALDQHNRTATSPDEKIKKVLLPGMGTGVGGISFRQCGQQTALAFKHFHEAKQDSVKWSDISWEMAETYAGEVRESHEGAKYSY